MTPDTVRLLPFGSGRPPAKTLGGIQTNLDAQAFDTTGNLLEGLYAVGEAAGFGGEVAALQAAEQFKLYTGVEVSAELVEEAEAQAN